MSFVLVKPTTILPTGISPRIHTSFNLSMLDQILGALAPGEILSLDFETNGDAGAENTYPVGVALASAQRMDYIDFTENGRLNGAEEIIAQSSYAEIMRELHRCNIPLLAHNVYFDCAWPLRDLDLWLNWRICTFALYKSIANEGFFGQRWGLKDAQTELLGWTETNEEALDRWLIDHGYWKSIGTKPSSFRYAYENWKNKKGQDIGLRYVTPNKAEMWRAPPNILGHYACLDAWSAHALYYSVLAPAMKKFEAFERFFTTTFMEYMEILARQKRRGMFVDMKQLNYYEKYLEDQISSLTKEFLSHPAVMIHTEAKREKLIAELLREEPETKFKPKKGPAVEPPKLTKKGKPNKSWDVWARENAKPIEPAYHWAIWNKRLQELREAEMCSPTSGDQLRWLLYEKMKFPVNYYTKTKTKNRVGPPPEPKPSTDKEALKEMGDVGKILIKLQRADKIRQFCALVRSLTWTDNTLHPSFTVPGTLTGRLGGRNPNIQNQPKDIEFLKIYRARPGYKIITCDVVSLENYVLAELSQDPTLLALYGPDARPGQDAYLFIASQLPVIGEKIRATGYDPYTSGPEETAKAKKECKKPREIGKKVYLSGNYGAGPDKLFASLRADGVDITLEQVRELHTGFWELRKGTKDYERELIRQWRKTGGWTIDGMGHPVCVAEKFKKDIVNRVVQRTGHTAFIKLLTVCDRMFREEGLDAQPLVADLHDCMIYEVADADVPRVVEIMEVDGYDALNAWLGGSIKLKGEAKVCVTWGDDKDETKLSLYTRKDGWINEKEIKDKK